jgi:predicted ATPase
MISAIRIKNFKGIRSIERLGLGPFHVLVGPNGSGKSTFLEAIEFVKSCLEKGPQKAVEERVPEYRDLTFMRRGGPIEIELWLDLSVPGVSVPSLHYKVALVNDQEVGVHVKVELLETAPGPLRGRSRKRLAGTTKSGKAFYKREVGNYTDNFSFGPDKLPLSLTPPDRTRYPTANAARDFLTQGVQFIQLNSRAMRDPCPAMRPTELQADGSNLARAVGSLFRQPILQDLAGTSEGDARILPGNGPRFDWTSRVRYATKPLRRWESHLRYAIEDLKEISWATRKPDQAEYLILKYRDGLECPSWLLSDGTLRMLALTLPAFLPAADRIYMIEEPEDGVHPKALEIILKALAAIPGAQVFVATHSPLVVQQVGVNPLLCFTRDETGVQVIAGSKHPALGDWNGVPELASVFSSRVLG